MAKNLSLVPFSDWILVPMQHLAVLAEINPKPAFQTVRDSIIKHYWCSDQNMPRWLWCCIQSDRPQHSHGHHSKPNYLNQYYCLCEKCPNHTFSLTISDASYKNTYGACDIRTLPMHNSKPCRNVTILGVALLPAQG